MDCSKLYNQDVERFRDEEYPMLKDAIYLDHAGTTLYSKSLMETYMADMMSNLYGNPHSASPSSQLSMNRIEDIRLRALQFFRADPDDFDLVFVANATAGIKLVMDSLQATKHGFTYGYHKDAHTSLVGVRESSAASRCLNDTEVEKWLIGEEEMVEGAQASSAVALFAYPAQSNMDGRRLPLSWSHRVRERNTSQLTTYTLLDAAAFVSTAQLDLSDASQAPDFTVLSFYKVFGFPDLGALIIRKDAGHIFQDRKYFGGGTVDVVISLKEQWHVVKTASLHESLEDGTLPFHNIMALKAAFDTHEKLFESMDRISKHTMFLAQRLFDGLSSLKHANSEPVCFLHSGKMHGNQQGPTIAFNIRNSQGAWVTNTEFERLAAIKRFHIRSGGLCNPGGIASSLDLAPWEMRRNFSAGLKCGAETDIYAGKITGVIRASLGAMSTLGDVEAFLSFIREFYEEAAITEKPSKVDNPMLDTLTVESLTVYPIKSCGGMSVPPGVAWEVRSEGLAWDREWCLIHQGTGQALSQKRHPKMTLIRSALDFDLGVLRVWFEGQPRTCPLDQVGVPLSTNPAYFKPLDQGNVLSSRVCGDAIIARTYVDETINSFFSSALGVPCVLARFPAGGSGFTTRHSKAHLQKHQQSKLPAIECRQLPGSYPDTITPPDSDTDSQKVPILLSNESPILAINRASIDALNDEIFKSGGKQASAAVFRANIVLAPLKNRRSLAYSEDDWQTIRIGTANFQMLGSCRRCHMICVDQETAEKNEEPFVTLARTRRYDSKVFFGVHMSLVDAKWEGQFPSIMVGESVIPDTAQQHEWGYGALSSRLSLSK